MNFCKLPPDKLRASLCVPAAFTLKRSMICFAKASTLAPTTIPFRTRPVRKPVSNALSCKLILGTAPRPNRSSGTKATPSRRRSAGPMLPIATPCNWIAPASFTGSSPLSAASNSSWPLPATPATPTISPLRTCRLILLSRVPNGSWVPLLNCITSKKASPPSALAYSVEIGVSSPTIKRAMEAGVSSAGLQLPDTLPPLNTVALSHSAFTSFNL